MWSLSFLVSSLHFILSSIYSVSLSALTWVLEAEHQDLHHLSSLSSWPVGFSQGEAPTGNWGGEESNGVSKLWDLILTLDHSLMATATVRKAPHSQLHISLGPRNSGTSFYISRTKGGNSFPFICRCLGVSTLLTDSLHPPNSFGSVLSYLMTFFLLRP